MSQVLPTLLQAFQSLKVLTIVSPELTSSLTITSPVSKATAIAITKVVDMVFREYLPQTGQDHPFWTMPQCRPPIYQAPKMVESLILDWQTFYSSDADTVIRSDSQRFYRDRHYETVFFSFVAAATNLRHLCLRYGNWRKLQLDLLDCSRLNRLEILELGGFYASFAHLTALLARNQGVLRAVDLQLVQLSSGDWEDVFVLLDTFPALEYLYVERCSYV